jgi:glycosyltransferase involved in cell wall biosynthesis
VVLDPQITEEVEVIVNIDDGQLSIGDKRNALLEMATGDYIAFVDDDDMVRTNYVRCILEAIQQNPDCVGIEGVITFNGNMQQGRKFIHSLQYRSWFEKDGVYYRNPNHLSPVKREHALKVKFPSKNHGEDHDYSTALLPFLNTEVYIKGPIYHYDYREIK